MKISHRYQIFQKLLAAEISRLIKVNVCVVHRQNLRGVVCERSRNAEGVTILDKRLIKNI